MARVLPLALVTIPAALFTACAAPWRSPDGDGVSQWSTVVHVAEDPWSSALVVVADDGEPTRDLRRGLVAALAADLERARSRPSWHRAELRIYVAGPRTGAVTELQLHGEHLSERQHDDLVRAFAAALERPDGAGAGHPLAVADDLLTLLHGGRAPRTPAEAALFGRLDPAADRVRAEVVVAGDGPVGQRPYYPYVDTDLLAPAAPGGRCDGAARFPELARGGVAPSCSAPTGLGLEDRDPGRLWIGASVTRCELTVRAGGCGARPGYVAVDETTCTIHALAGLDAASCEGGDPSATSGFCLVEAGGPDATVVFAGGASPRRGDTLGVTCARSASGR